MIEAIIFDFDGVIHDTFDIAHGTLKHFYPDISAEEYKSMFEGNIYAHTKVGPICQETFFKIQHPKYESLEIREEIKKELIHLKQSYPLYIISSNSEKTLNTYFENNGIINLFTEVLGTETHKSKVWKFEHIMKKYGLTNDKCIFITDTLGDILEAKKLDIPTIAVDYGFHDRKRLEKGNPYKIISDFEKLESTIKEYQN